MRPLNHTDGMNGTVGPTEHRPYISLQPSCAKLLRPLGGNRIAETFTASPGFRRRRSRERINRSVPIVRNSSMPTDSSKIISDAAYQAYERRLLHQVKQPAVPHHVAFIMDGNRRFAREIGLGNVLDCHTKGRDKLEEVLEWCLDVGVRILTVFAFSTENIRRESEEVQHLMHLFAENFRKVGDDERVHRHKIRVSVFGNRELLPAEVIDAIEYAEARTKDYDQYRFNVAVAYGGREEILLAIRNVVRDAQAGKVDPADVDEKFFSKRLYTADLPDPDLVLRTSGEERISNFLLWQLAYAELYFVDVYWPGFRKIDFLRALRSYQMRQRRYGE